MPRTVGGGPPGWRGYLILAEPRWGSGGGQHGRHLAPGGLLSVGGAGAGAVDGVPGSDRGERSPGQEDYDQSAGDHGLDPVHGAPERVAVRPQPAAPRPRRGYCRPPEHPGFTLHRHDRPAGCRRRRGDAPAQLGPWPPEITGDAVPARPRDDEQPSWRKEEQGRENCHGSGRGNRAGRGAGRSSPPSRSALAAGCPAPSDRE